MPAPLDGVRLTGLVDPVKDVDGLTPVSAGLLALGRPGLRPCTPQGVMELLAHAGARLEGAEAVVVGRSNLFGKPMAQLLLAANATVTTAHSRTRDLAAVCRRADVLIVAVGRAGLVRGDWVKPGAIVIDVGMNRTDRRPRGGRRLRRGVRGGRRDHARARRRRADDHRVPAAQHAARGRAPGGPPRGRARGAAVKALRGGELLAGVGAIGLLAALFLDWFGGPGRGWSALGWLMVVLLVLAALAALWLVLTTARRRVAQSVAAGVVTAPVGALVFLVLLVRVLVLGDRRGRARGSGSCSPR